MARAKGNVGLGDTRTLTADTAEQMAAMDTLPRKVKELLWQLPIPQDVRQVKEVLEIFGVEEGLRLMEAEFKRQYPEWELRPYSLPLKARHRA